MELMDKMSFQLAYLNCTESIIKYSFLVHRSITYLDLSLQEYSIYKKKRKNKMAINYTPITISYNYVYRREDFHNSVNPFQTRLLSCLHLDLCREREKTVRGFLEERYMINREKFHDYITVYDAKPQSYFYEMKLNQFIENALLNNVQKMPLLKLYLKLMKQEQFSRYYAYSCPRNLFFNILLKECSDPHLIVDILKIFNFKAWIIDRDYPEKLDFFLHHVYFLRREKEMLKMDLIYFCIAESCYENAEVLFKYQDAPRISERSYQQTLSRLRGKRDMTFGDLEYRPEHEERRMNSFYAIQTFLVFLSKSTSGFQVLQLLWRSIPDRFLILDEFKTIYGHKLSQKDIGDIYNFYTDITEQDVLVRQPRMLKHFCRLTIRAILAENGHLREGIYKLGLPSDIQSYLKLQK